MSSGEALVSNRANMIRICFVCSSDTFWWLPELYDFLNRQAGVDGLQLAVNSRRIEIYFIFY